MTTSESTGRDTLTNSAMTVYRRCPREYYWSYDRGWRPARIAKALRIGSMVHHGLNLLAEGKGLQHIKGVIDELYAQAIVGTAEWPDPAGAEYDLSIECVTVKHLVGHYPHVWRDSPLVIVASETSFDLPIINPASGRPIRIFRQAGRRDRICNLPGDDLALLETKTVSEDIGAESDYRRAKKIDQQVSMYLLASRAEGYDIRRIVFDLIRKPSIKPTPIPVRDESQIPIVLDENRNRVKTRTGSWRKTGDVKLGYILQTQPMTPSAWSAKLSTDILQRPEWYYARFESPRLDAELAEFQHELWMLAQQIHAARKSGQWYRDTNSCRRFGRLCPYFPLCAGEVDIDNGVPAGFRQVETVHEELAEEEGSK